MTAGAPTDDTRATVVASATEHRLLHQIMGLTSHAAVWHRFAIQSIDEQLQPTVDSGYNLLTSTQSGHSQTRPAPRDGAVVDSRIRRPI